jgi:hypothetical protein
LREDVEFSGKRNDDVRDLSHDVVLRTTENASP